MNQFIKVRSIILILILGILLRLVVINQSLWLDEAIGALVARDQTYTQIITQFPKSDNHPPLYYLVLKGWTDIFGNSEASLRFPSIIFGLGSIWLVYLIALKIDRDKRKFAVLAAILLATSPFHIYYSQEARMYMMAAFFASSAICSFLYLTEQEGKNKIQPFWWVAYSFSITALVFTDYVPVLLLPAFWIWAYFKKMEKAWWVIFFLSYLPMLVLGYFWLSIFLYQMERGRWLLSTLPAWGDIAGGATVKQAILVWMKFVLGRISLKNKLLYYLSVSFASVPIFLTLLRAWVARKRVLLIWIWLLLPLVTGYLVSYIFPAFIYFRFTYVVPAFYLIVGWGITRVKDNFLQKSLITSIIIINLSGWLIYVTGPDQQREQWRQAVQFIEKRVKIEEIALFEFPQPFAPYNWYSTEAIEAQGATDSISANKEKTVEKTKKAIQNKKGVYYFEYLGDLSDPERYVELGLFEAGFTKGEVFDLFPGVGQITYYKSQ